MLNIDVYNQKGEKVGKIDIPKNVFDLEPNADLIHQVYVAQQANSRIAIAHTKTRGEVRGGGKKPWKQKGTGRARHGSTRSPIWKGGGVTFGPRSNRNFSKDINKKQKQKALFMMLSSKFNDGEMVVLDKISFGKVKTKEADKVLNIISKKILKKDKRVKILIILPKKNQEILLSLRNIPLVKLSYADSLNVGDLLNYKYVVILKDSFDIIEKTYIKLRK